MAKNKICIIGAGKIGTALSLSLSYANYEVNYIIDRNKRKLSRINKAISNVKSSLVLEAQFIGNSSFIFITVQDRYIKEVIDEILKQGIDLRSKIIIHCSGALSSDILLRKGINKANIASFHPIQSLIGTHVEKRNYFSHIYFGIEGGAKAVTFLKKLTKDLQSEYIELSPKNKYLYHAGSVIASNFLVAYMDVIEEIIKKAGIKPGNPYKLYKGIISRTLDNIEQNGAVSSLTGPIERNDTEVFIKQIEEIKKKTPKLLNFYLEMSRITARVAFKKKSVSRKQYQNLLNIINGYTPTS